MTTNDFLEELFWLISWLPTYFLLTKFQEYPSTPKFHHFLKRGGFLSQPLLIYSSRPTFKMYTGRPTYTMTEIDGQESIEIKKGLIQFFRVFRTYI